MSQRLPTRPALALLTTIAAVGTAGSLYFSEVLGLVPCELCWIQRILLYPQVVILGVAAIERRGGVWLTALPLSLFGIAVSSYHTWLQLTPSATCSPDGGCGSILYSALGGLVTIPRLALVAFTLLSIGLLALAVADRRQPA